MDYARALVEHPKWRWEPGMVTTHHVDGYSSKLVGSPGVVDFNGCPEGRQRHGKAWWLTPDLSSPATKGWLLHMLLGVAEAVHFETDPNGSAEVYVKWSINGETQRRWFRGDEAIAAALLAVWGQA